MKKDFRDFINVINNMIFGKEIDISGINPENMYALAQAHSMSKLWFEFVKKHYGADSDMYKACVRQNDLINYKYICQSREYKALCATMNDKNISYLPFKGTVIKQLYPSPELREMSDIDIMTDDMHGVHEYLQAVGYKFEHKGHHDVYTKEPGICFEVHETLVDKQRDTGFDKFFEKPWSLAEKSNGTEWRLTPENEFVYLMAHLYGHFHQGGIGIRAVLDIMLYKKSHRLDFEYINAAFEENGISKFAENILNLADAWFADGKMSPVTEELGEYIITSGTYGKIERMKLDLSKGELSKIKNIQGTVKRKLFLSKKEIRVRYPWSKNVILLPAAYAVRIFDVLLNHGKEARHWLKGFKTLDADSIGKHKERMRRFGIKV